MMNKYMRKCGVRMDEAIELSMIDKIIRYSLEEVNNKVCNPLLT